jgi:putative ABC transport system permease protein
VNLFAAVADGFAEVRAHARRTTLQTLGVIMGVASVVATLGMMAGEKAQSMRYYEQSGGVLKGAIFPKPVETVRTSARDLASRGLTLADANAIRASVPGLAVVEVQVSRELLVRSTLAEKVYDVSGVGPGYMDLQDLWLDHGRFITDDDMASAAAVCVLGADRARELFGTGDPVGGSVRIGSELYRVAGVMKFREFYWGREDYNGLGWMNELLMVPATAMLAREVGAGEDRISSVWWRLKSADDFKETVPALGRLMLARHGVEDFRVWSRQDRMQQMEQQGQVYNITFTVCGAIALIVGCIVVANILLASLTERMREVGVRKALGAKGWHVAVQFLVESLVVSGLGGAVGLALGVGFVHAIAAALSHDPVLTPTMLVGAVLSAGLVGLISGLYPAFRAWRLDPVVALRYE